jgi:RNA polymerase sigma factor (sigma-70 family)
MEDREWYAIPDDGPGLDAQERLLLQDALAILGDEERRIVLLHTAGLKHRETGEALGLPLATVLSKYHRALKKMRAYMEGDDAR